MSVISEGKSPIPYGLARANVHVLRACRWGIGAVSVIPEGKAPIMYGLTRTCSAPAVGELEPLASFLNVSLQFRMAVD